MDMTPLTRTVFAGATNLALASLVVALIGLLLARIARRSAPLRHGLAFGTVCLLLLLPATPFLAALIDARWIPQVSLIQWPTTTASWNVATNSTPSEQPGAPAGSSSSATPGGTAGLSSSADPASGATGSASPSTLRTLTANEIPAGAILPGQSAKSQPSFAERRGSTPPLSPRINLVTAGLAIVALWLLGTSLSLLLTIRSAARVSRLVKAALPVADPGVHSLLDRLATQLRLRRSPQLRSSTVVGVPFAWGPFRPVIVLPHTLVNTGDIADLQPVLLHELAHVRRRDVWIGLLQRIVAAMYWWNPLVHRLNAKLSEAREEICDAHVLAGGCPPREYAELLVDLAARISLPQPAAAPGLLTRSETELTRRVQHLLEDPPMSTSLRWFGKMALLALIIISTTTAILVAAVIVNEQQMSSVHLAVKPSFSISQYVPASKMEPIAVPATRPAAQTFEVTDPFGEKLEGSMPASPTATSVPSPDPLQQPGMPIRRERGAPTTIVPDTAFAAGDERNTGSSESFDFGFPDDKQFEPDSRGDESLSPLDKADANDPDFAPPIANPSSGALIGTAVAAPRDLGPGGEPSARPLFLGAGSIHGLAVIELVGNDDGSLKDLRWFTESLGNDAAAATKLTERLTAFAAAQPTTAYRMEPRTIMDATGIQRTTYVAVPMQTNAPTSTFQPYDPAKPVPAGTRTAMQRVLAAQITASPQLRYEHVAKIIALSEPHVQRVIIGQSDLTPELTLTLGFVRDGAGKKISASPVLIWNNAVLSVPHFKAGDGNVPVQQPSEPHDKIVEVHSLPPLLLNWRQTLSGDEQPKSLAARIRADDGVEPKLVEEVVQAILPAGFERVVLEPLAPQQTDVEAVVTKVVDTESGTRVTISVGADDGVQIGWNFDYRYTAGPPDKEILDLDQGLGPSQEIVGTLEVIGLGLDQAECRVLNGNPAPAVGTTVNRQTGQAPAASTQQPEIPPAVAPAYGDKTV